MGRTAQVVGLCSFSSLPRSEGKVLTLWWLSKDSEPCQWSPPNSLGPRANQKISLLWLGPIPLEGSSNWNYPLINFYYYLLQLIICLLPAHKEVLLPETAHPSTPIISITNNSFLIYFYNRPPDHFMYYLLIVCDKDYDWMSLRLPTLFVW